LRQSASLDLELIRMIRIAVSQRVDILKDRGERRDAVDQRLCAFLAACDCLAMPVPNLPHLVEPAYRAARWQGVALSGGNDLVAYGGDAPERDATERALIALARREGLPLLGVCRGMQMIVHDFGGALTKVDGHVARRHEIHDPSAPDKPRRMVNSYHSMAAAALPPALDIWALTDDGGIEAVRHKQEPISAIMWHPEREESFAEDDVRFVRDFFHQVKA
jgi:N5-(cytidine 5'-diphosphoramidyl)-L-glutamine hydrolase